MRSISIKVKVIAVSYQQAISKGEREWWVVFKIRSDVHAFLDFQKLMRSVQMPQGSSSHVEDD